MTAVDFLAHPERVNELEPAELGPLLCQLAAACVVLASRMATTTNGTPAEPDRLLNATEARALLGGISRDHLYNAASLRDARRKVGRRVLFSARALQKLIERRTGR